MHDGRFYSLGQVIEHYRTGIQQSNTLDPSLANGIEFTPKEKYDLVLFLGTLTDSSFLKNPRFAQPG
jgi:cytochrome c peroxidase